MIDFEAEARAIAAQGIRDLVGNEQIWMATYDILALQHPKTLDVMDLPDDVKEEVYNRLADELEEIASALEM